jgi:hypothetical protein
MPITVTFDVRNPTSAELNRIRGRVERLGWEHLGNTAYRYPKLHGQHPTEDWAIKGNIVDIRVEKAMSQTSHAKDGPSRGRTPSE